MKKIRVRRGVSALTIPSLPEKEMLITAVRNKWSYAINNDVLRIGNDWGDISVEEFYIKLKASVADGTIDSVRTVIYCLQALDFI